MKSRGNLDAHGLPMTGGGDLRVVDLAALRERIEASCRAVSVEDCELCGRDAIGSALCGPCTRAVLLTEGGEA